MAAKLLENFVMMSPALLIHDLQMLKAIRSQQGKLASGGLGLALGKPFAINWLEMLDVDL